jgi:hypothetical protein
MIFADKDTAMKFRNKAESDLLNFLLEVAQTGMKYQRLIDSSGTKFDSDYLYRIIASMYRDKNSVFKTLLFQSGMIFESNNDSRYHDIILYYDDDSNKENNYEIASAMRKNCRKMIGGIDINTGSIHT